MNCKIFLALMAKEVIKTDGSKESFDATKVKKSIETAAAAAGLSVEEMHLVVKQVFEAVMKVASAKPEIATAELRDVILDELDRIKPEVSAAWRKYDETKSG